MMLDLVSKLYGALKRTRTQLLCRISNKCSFVQFLATFLGTLNVISSGMHYGWSSPSFPKLQSNESTISITNGEGSAIATVMLIGAVPGSLAAAVLIDKIGRKNTILISTIPAFIAWLIVAFSGSFAELMVARCIAGIADGLIFCSITVYISEIAHPKYRGMLCSILGVLYTFGNLLVNIIGSRLSITSTALISCSLPAFQLITFCWMPESPYYLLMKNDVDGAKLSLRIFNGTVNVEDDLSRISHGIADQKSKSGNCLDLITKTSNRRAMLITMVLRTVQETSGAMAIVFYVQSIFSDVNGAISADDCAAIYLGIQLLTTTVFSLVTSKAGKKPLLIISLGGCGLALFTTAFYFYAEHHTNFDVTDLSLLPLISLTIYVVMFGVALQTIPNVVVGELFPIDVKAYAVSFGDIYFAAISAVVSIYFQITKDEFGLEVPFFTFGTFCLLGMIFVIVFMFETKNKTLEEIQSILNAKSMK